MSLVFKQYLKDHNYECPYNAHTLVNYSKQQPNLKNLSWLDAHVLIEHYMLHNTILHSQSDVEEFVDDNASQQSLSSLSKQNTQSILYLFNKYQSVKSQSKLRNTNYKYNSLFPSYRNRIKTPSISHSNSLIISTKHIRSYQLKKYPNKQRKKELVTNHCWLFIGIILLICCIILSVFGGCYVLLMGTNTESYADEFEIKGKCICIESIQCKSGCSTYDHLWRIYNKSICNGIRNSNYTFKSFTDENIYQPNTIYNCYTNDKCDYIFIDKYNDKHQNAMYLFVAGGCLLIISICCCVFAIYRYKGYFNLHKLCYCVYCDDCRDYYSEKDKYHHFSRECDKLNQTELLDIIVNNYCRKYQIKLNKEIYECLHKYSIENEVSPSITSTQMYSISWDQK